MRETSRITNLNQNRSARAQIRTANSELRTLRTSGFVFVATGTIHAYTSATIQALDRRSQCLRVDRRTGVSEGTPGGDVRQMLHSTQSAACKTEKLQPRNVGSTRLERPLAVDERPGSNASSFGRVPAWPRRPKERLTNLVLGWDAHATARSCLVRCANTKEVVGPLDSRKPPLGERHP
jgi:hypothetical protein